MGACLYDRASMATATTGVPDRPRPIAAAALGWLLGIGGAGLAVAVGRGLDDPAVALVGMAMAVVVMASLVGGSLPGLAAAAVVALLTWRWLDPPEPLASGYEIGVGVGGVLVALGIGAAGQLRSFDRMRAGWLDRLDQLAEDLSHVSGVEDPLPLVREAARRASGATSAVVDPPDGGAGPGSDAPGERVVVSSRTSPPLVLELALPAAPPAILAGDFTAFLRSIADQCAQALQHAALERAERRASADLERLARASSALSASLDVAQVLATVTDLVVPSLADECAVRIAPRAGQRRLLTDAPPPDDVGTRTVALVAHGDLIGHLTIRRRARALDAEEVDAALLLAEPIGRALDHALLFAEQVRTSSTLEQSLLPEAILPIQNLEVATRYLAAAEGHAAGGDFYDVVLTMAGTAVLIVGDVQGKGVEAATLTSTARHTLRTAALGGAGPAAMLHQLNLALLYGQAERLVATAGDPSIRFVTAAVVSLTPTEGGFRAVVASGGHPPVLVIHPEGAVDQLVVDGVLLGVFDDAHYDEVTVELGLSDIVVLYTDGVTEQRAQPDLFNEIQLGRLVRNMRTARQADADAAAQLILDTVVGLSPREVRDDIALVVARVTGPR
jgi:serine phosphatase RsbU (regulator of sigma subunit)